MGRPKKKPENRRTYNCSYKCIQKEYEALDKASKKAGLTKSNYIRYFVPELNGGKFPRKRPSSVIEQKQRET